MKKEKYIYLDVARIIATIAVVLVHIASLKPNWTIYDFDSPEWKIFCSYALITKWAAPLFCLISGALFLDPDKNVTAKKLYTKNIPRILVGLIVWSTFHILSLVHIFDMELTTAAFIKKVAAGHYHQWYLYMIIGFYILVPVLRKITADKKSTQYLLAIAIAINFVIPFLQLHQKLDWTVSITDQMFMELPGYLAYFLVGYYIHKYDFSKITKAFIYIGGVASFFIAITQTIAKSIENNAFFKPYTNYYSVTVLIQTIFMFVLIKDICSKINFKPRCEKALAVLSKDTFGIYQMHPFFIMVFAEYFGINTTAFGTVTVTPIIAIPVILVVTYVICEVISHILNKIPLIKTYLV